MQMWTKRNAKVAMLCVIGFALNLFGATTVAETALTSNATDIDSLASLNQIDSDEQLAILKQSVLDYAMERNASVAAASWTDNDGALKEEVMMFSNLQLEKLRPQPYHQPLWSQRHAVSRERFRRLNRRRAKLLPSRSKKTAVKVNAAIGSD